MLNNKLVGVRKGEIRRILVTMPPRHGKALALDTPIPTPNGWVTMGVLRPGDTVFGADGVPCRVVGVSEVWKNRPVYRVSTDDGDEIIADADHEWLIRACRKRPHVQTIHTTEWLAKPRQRATMIQMHGALQMAEADLALPPYILGLWLGDGTTAQGNMTAGDEDREWIRGEFERAGYRTTEYAGPMQFGVPGLRVQLRQIGVLGDKHIPLAYRQASAAQRLELLQGLIDSDGHVAPDGQVEFCSINFGLAQQVQELVRSLGCKVSLIVGRATLNGRDICAKYRVMFYMAGAARLPRKAIRCRNGVKQPNHYVRAEPAGTADTICIEVDSPDHLFLAGQSMLPTHNSETTSKTFPVNVLVNNPKLRVMLASYAAEFAAGWGRKARDLMVEAAPMFGLRVREDVAARDAWELAKWQHGFNRFIPTGGGMVTAGIGGPLTGRGGDIIIIDDPVKNAEEAFSQTYRDKTWEWFTSTLYSRLEPGAAIALIQTRWHSDDLAGRIMSEMAEGGEQWEVINLPALAEDDDPLGREIGAALWPDRYDETRLKEIEKTIGPYWFASLYQQTPIPVGKGLFQREDARRFTETEGAYFLEQPDGSKILIPKSQCIRFSTMDLAVSTKTSADYTAIGTFALTPTKDLLILDMRYRRLEGPDQLPMIQSVYMDYKPSQIYIEKTGYQLALIQQAVRAGLPVLPITPDGDKIARALLAAARMRAGALYFPHYADWLEGKDGLYDQLYGFPSAAHDDLTDCISYAAFVATGVGYVGNL